jgi:hypothetical protein
MEIKIPCDCGQKYAFDVEPISGQMPFVVNCPVCGADGTPAANDIIQIRTVSTPTAPIVRIHRPAAPPAITPPLPAGARAASRPAKAAGESNIGLGILGAVLGAALGSALMFGFFKLTGFRFPLLGFGTGALTGYGARLLYRGTDQILGALSAAFALAAVCGTLYLMYGEVPMLNIISIIISAGVAYRIAA